MKLSRRKIFKKNYINAGLLLLPAIVVIALVFFYPIVEVVRSSFYYFQSEVPIFVGFNNFRIIFGDEKFWISIRNNFILVIGSIPILVFLSLIFSVFLYDRIKFWKGYRFISFLPYVIPITVVSVVFSYILMYKGVLNETLRIINLDFFVIDWFRWPNTALIAIMFVIMWKELGFGIMLMIARILSLSEDVFEAAKIDGANWWQNFIHVIVPQLRTIIEFYIVILTITMFSWVFNYVYIMTKGGPGVSTWVGEMYIYQYAFRHLQRGIASATALIFLVITLIIVIIQLYVYKKEKYEETK